MSISKTVQPIFTYVTFRQSCLVSFEIERLKAGHHCCLGNQFLRECSAKSHYLTEEKWHFLKISN